jgi:MoaA/NifB/PqqE/SkfB family radical SAM enzyme
LENNCFIIDKFLKACENWHVKPVLIIAGGEPFACRELIEICDYYDRKSKNSELIILTNATLINDKNSALLSRYNIRFFQVSLDGFNPETHDKSRGKGSFNRAFKGIKYLQEHKFKISINSILARQTVGYIEEL